MTLFGRLRLAIDALRGRWQQQSISSLAAQVVARAVASAHTTSHPLRHACETYFVVSASDIVYYVGDLDYDHPVARDLTERMYDISRAYISTGGVLLTRSADDRLVVYDWTHVSMRDIEGQYVASVDGQVVIEWQAVLWGQSTITHVVSPADVAQLELALDSATKEYALSILHADPYFSRMLIPREPLSELSVRQLTESLNARGREVKGQLAVMPIPLDVHIATPTISELQLQQITSIAEATTAAVYGIPLQLIGFSSAAQHQTYANREQASRDYTQRVLVPYWRYVARAVSSLYGVDVYPDLDSVEALKTDNSAYALSLYDAGNGLITRDEARALIGYEPIGNGSSIEQSGDLMQWYQQVQGYYSLVERSIADALQQAYAQIAHKINAFETRRDKLVYLYSSEFQSDLERAIDGAISKHVDTIVESAYRKAHRKGMTYDKDPISVARQSLQQRLREEVRYKMSYTVDTLRRQIDEMVESGIDVVLDAAHAILVARTMATSVVAVAQTQTWQAMERVSRLPIRIRKMWMSQRDDRVRDSHDAADGQIVDLDGLFTLPGKDGVEYASHPGDSRLSASNVINCRCVIVPRTERRKR